MQAIAAQPEQENLYAAVNAVLDAWQVQRVDPDRRLAPLERLGLADECVPPRVMESAARQLALNPPARKPLPFMQRLFAGPLKGVVASKARQQVAKRARPEHYPAPYAIIDLWARYGGNALAAPEITDRIVRSTTARNLVRPGRLNRIWAALSHTMYPRPSSLIRSG